MARRTTPKSKRASTRKKTRKLSPSARDNIGYPTQREYPTTRTKRGVTPVSKQAYGTSVVWVGLSADLLTDKKIASLVKSVADRARHHISKGKQVSARVVAAFAKLHSKIGIEDEAGDLEIIDLGAYDDEFFPDVGEQWEWRSRYHGHRTRFLMILRDMVRDQLYQAKDESQDANFVFVDSIEITRWG